MNKIKALCAGLLFTFLFSFTVQAQRNAYKKGTIIVDQKKTIDAYIQMDFRFPQRFQSSITYISPEAYENFQQSGTLKEKAKESFKPKKIVGFDLEDGRSFRTVKYTDLSRNSTSVKVPEKLCLEQVIDGKINLYKMYSHTTGEVSQELSKVVLDSKTEGDELLIDYLKDNFQLLVQKDSDNAKNLMVVSLLNYFGDNETVKENYTNNQYGFRDEFIEKQSGVIVDKKFETAFLRLLQDYDPVVSGQLSK